MCDYSLAGVPNRLAAAGEELIVHRFRTGSIGFAPAESFEEQNRPAIKATGWAHLRLYLRRMAQPAPSAVVCAVCIPPGARLRLSGFPERLQRELEIGETEEVTFVQLSADAHRYRDAVRFSNGIAILLQCLARGQRACVLRLDGEEQERETAPVAFVDMR